MVKLAVKDREERLTPGDYILLTDIAKSKNTMEQK